jgi:hypothetical protein
VQDHRITSGFAGPGQHVNFDNVQVADAVPAIGGTTAFSTATDTASITVTPEKDDLAMNLTGHGGTSILTLLRDRQARPVATLSIPSSTSPTWEHVIVGVAVFG